MDRYRKAIVAILGAAVQAALQVGFTGRVQQVLSIIAALLTAAGVYQVRNARTSPIGLSEGGASE